MDPDTVPLDVNAILDSDETIQYQCGASRKSRALSYLVGRWSTLVLVTIIGISLSDGLATGYLPNWLPDVTAAALVLGGYTLWFVFKIWKHARADYTYYVTDEKAIRYKDAPAERTVGYVDHEKVNNLSLERDRINKLCNTSSLHLATERGYRSLTLDHIDSGEAPNLVNEIQSRTET